jgi:hypothetical protein
MVASTITTLMIGALACAGLTATAQTASAATGLCGSYSGNAPQCQNQNGRGNGFYNYKMDPRFNYMADPRFNYKADPRFNYKADPRFNYKADPRFNPMGDPCGIFGSCN